MGKKMAQKWQKIEKWPQIPFLAIFGPFFPPFPPEGHFLFFGQFFSLFGFRPVFHSIPGCLTRKSRILWEKRKPINKNTHTQRNLVASIPRRCPGDDSGASPRDIRDVPTWFLSKSLLCLLSRRILWIFFSCLPGNFALKNGGDFWWFFSGLRFPRIEARKVLEKFGGKFGAKFGAKFGTKIRKIRETFVLRLSWPNKSRQVGQNVHGTNGTGPRDGP